MNKKKIKYLFYLNFRNLKNFKEYNFKNLIKNEKIDLDLEILDNNFKRAPYSYDAEIGILSCVFADLNAFEIINNYKIKFSDFYKEYHSIIFKAMNNLYKLGNSVNVVNTVDELIKMQSLDRAKGVSYVSSLGIMFSTISHFESYCKIVKDKSNLRKLINLANKISNFSFKQSKTVSEILDFVEKSMLLIREDIFDNKSLTIKDIVKNAIINLEKIHDSDNKLSGISSGFSDLDKFINGFQSGELTIIASRPSMGKTAFALNIVLSSSIELNLSVGLFSLEMESQQLMYRLLGMLSNLDLARMRTGNIKSNEFSKLIESAYIISRSKIIIDDSVYLTISGIRNKVKRMIKMHNTKIIVIDYLQLMSSKDNFENRSVEISYISKGLKNIAKELKIPVIALSQLNRSVEGRPNKRPIMSDLRESGAIEQDADVVSFLYRDEYYLREETPKDKIGLTEFIISKNRNGPTGVVKLKFINNMVKFVNIDENK